MPVHPNLEVKLLSDDLFAQAPQIFGRLGVIGVRLQRLFDDVAVAKESTRLRFDLSIHFFHLKDHAS